MGHGGSFFDYWQRMYLKVHSSSGVRQGVTSLVTLLVTGYENT